MCDFDSCIAEDQLEEHLWRLTVERGAFSDKPPEILAGSVIAILQAGYPLGKILLKDQEN